MYKILIIDDETNILFMLKKMLERSGYETELATNGVEGIELLKKCKPDLVITDIIMPEKEGLETIREMKRLKSDLKIIAMSGGGKVSADNYLMIAKIFGASKMIAKPFAIKDMLSAVQELLNDESVGKDSILPNPGKLD
ncbi:MAG: response regulator [Bacteroidetes bacterium]|nr:response regulator [Bacteroidota bacterium]